MRIYDHITADAIDEGDLVFYQNDYIEVTSKIDDGSILIKGYSHTSGDTVTYILTADTEVGLWTAS